MPETPEHRYPRSIDWMARHPVTANLIMLVFLLGGALIIFTQVKQEVEPNFEVDMVSISVPYPGAAPAEIEQGILLAIEEAVRGLDGIKEIRATANEGSGSVMVELLNKADINKATSDIKNAIDRISSFPPDAERPVVKTYTTGREVVGLILYGEDDHKVLHHLAESVRDDLLKEPMISKVLLRGIRPMEIKIEIPQEKLRNYGFTLEALASMIARSAVELPGGGIKTGSGEVLIRTTERRERGAEFANLPIISSKDGSRIRLGDIAEIVDGFEDVDIAGFYNGQPSVWIRVFRVGDETPLEVAEAVKAYLEQLEKELPPSVKAAVFFDTSEMFHDRIDLLKRNAIIGLLLVLLILGLFLEIRLAFWVTMGIPISFLGSFIFLPAADVSINMYSLFAFIVTLGMVVDDAIIIGENIYVHRQRGVSPIEAAIKGASEVATPVIFSILTTVVAFSPLLFIPGIWGKYFRIMPLVIITVLLISLFESLFILPAHLAHLKKAGKKGLFGKLHQSQQVVSRFVEHFSENIYGPAVKFAVRHEWVTWATAVAILIALTGFVSGGRIEIEYFPKMDTSWVTANAALPFGVPMKETRAVQHQIEQAAYQVKSSTPGFEQAKLVKGMYSFYNGSHQVMVFLNLVGMEQREMSATDFVQQWREKIGVLPSAKNLSLDATFGSSMGGKALNIRLSHKDVDLLERAAKELASSLKAYNGVYDIDSGFTEAKAQLDLKLTSEARSLGLTSYEVGRQIRGAFFGVEALRQQRGRNMIRIMVRLPKEERRSIHDINHLMIRTPNGGEIPLSDAVDIQKGRSYPTITRTDGQRTIHVTGEVDSEVANSRKIIGSLAKNELPKLIEKHRGLDYSFQGAERSGSEAMSSLLSGFVIALLVMYVLIAIPFGSYIQPLAVLSAIPFGLVGAIIGHLIMGYNLSIVSMMGLVALSGVVVNDSLVLIHTANRYVQQGMKTRDAAASAGIRRLRPIMLTSLTTFLGLTPMIFETSVQARSLIPMALSLGFGVLFSTFIILLMVPAFYVILQDTKALFSETGRDVMRILRFPFHRKK